MIESKLLRRALTGDLKSLLLKGFDPAMLRAPYAFAFQLLIEHFRNHGELPGPKRLIKKCEDAGVTGVVIAPAEDTTSKGSVYWEQILNERLDHDLETTLEELAVLYNERQVSPSSFIDAVMGRMKTLSVRYQIRDSRSSTSADVAALVLDAYAMTKAGKAPGIEIDPELKMLVDAMVRLKPGHITSIIARTKVGKTWLALILALWAAKTGTRILIASMEMPEEDIGRRLVCLAGKINFDLALKGKLEGEEEERFLRIGNEMRARKGFWANFKFMNPADIIGVEAVETQAALFDAQLVVADAFYDWRSDLHGPAKKWERIEHNLTLVRQVSLASRRHWLLTVQFNKEARDMGSTDEFAVGGADAFNYQSNTTIYLVRNKRDKKAGRVTMVLGNARDAAPSRPLVHNWDFFKIDYSPIGYFDRQSAVAMGGGGDI